MEMDEFTIAWLIYSPLVWFMDNVEDLWNLKKNIKSSTVYRLVVYDLWKYVSFRRV